MRGLYLQSISQEIINIKFTIYHIRQNKSVNNIIKLMVFFIFILQRSNKFWRDISAIIKEQVIFKDKTYY